MNARRLVTGLLVAVVLVGAYLLLSGEDDAYTVKAELPNAGGVKPNSSVKVAGVPGGTVKDLEITPRDTVIATLKLEDSVQPIGRDAKIEIRPTDLLGERYIALDVGNADDKPLEDGGRLPTSSTKLPVELDDVVNTFDGDTRERIKVLINEFGIALGNRGKDLAQLLDTMPPSLTDARELVAELAAEDESLKNLLAKGDAVTQSVDGRKNELGRLIAQADTTLGELAERRDKLGRTIDAAPGGLAALNTTLSQLRVASTNLRPASVDLRNAAAPLKDTLDALPGLESSARDSLKAAKTAAPSLTKLGTQATGPLQALTPTLAKLEETSGFLKPTLDHLDERGFEDINWFMQNITLGTKKRDALGHMIGAQVVVNPETVLAAFDQITGGGQTPEEDDAQPTRSKSKAKGADRSPASPTPAPATPEAAPAKPATAAPATKDDPPTSKGLLDDVGNAVKGLLGGSQPKDSTPGADTLPGLLNRILVP